MAQQNHFNKIVSFFIFLAAAGFFATSAQAGWFKKTPEDRAEHFVEKIDDELNLTEEQQTQLKGFVLEVMTAAKESRPEKGKVFDLAIEQVQSGQIDRTRVKQEMQTHKARFEKLADMALERADQFLATLSPEQRTKAAEVLGEWKERFAKHGGRHHGPFWH